MDSGGVSSPAYYSRHTKGGIEAPNCSPHNTHQHTTHTPKHTTNTQLNTADSVSAIDFVFAGGFSGFYELGFQVTVGGCEVPGFQ